MITKEKERCIEIYQEGLSLYRKRLFKEAIEKFKRALEFCPEDGPSKLLLERCFFLIENPPDKEWDGVFEMKTK